MSSDHLVVADVFLTNKSEQSMYSSQNEKIAISRLLIGVETKGKSLVKGTLLRHKVYFV